jgi:CRP-like cAMP-binding protein
MIFSEEEEKRVVEELLQYSKEQIYKRGDQVYQEDDSPEYLYYIQSGLVGLTKVTHSGNESLLRIFKPGQFFGHRSLFSEEPYHASAKCLEPTLILAVRREKVTETFDAHPRAYYFLSRALAKELRRAENRSVLVSEAHITERVAAALLLFKKLYPEHLWTRSEIANYCATRTPTVIKILSELEKQGAIIQQRRHIEIKDESVLLSHLGEGLDSLQ